MRVAVFGTSDVTAVCDIIRASGDSIAAMVYPENRKNSGKVGRFRTSAERCGRVPLMHPVRKNDREFLRRLAACRADIGIVWSYSQIFEPATIRLFPQGMINYHGALLPDYRGGNVLNWVLVNGETRTGVTFHFIDAGIDTGDIVAQREVPIAPADDARSLALKLERTAVSLFASVWPQIRSGAALRLPQPPGGRYFCRRTREDGRIDWQRPARDIHNLVRALVHPFPGAYFTAGEAEFVVRRSRVEANAILSGAAAGEIVTVDSGTRSLLVQTGDGLIALMDIEMKGSPVDTEDFRRFQTGIVLQ